MSASAQELDNVTQHDAKVLEMVFNPEGTMMPEEELQSVPLAIDEDLLRRLKSLEAEAVVLAEKSRLDDAIAKFTEAIQLCPHYASGYNNRAQAYRINGDNEAAITDLNKAIEFGTGQPAILKQAYTQRGIIERNQGDTTAAQRDFELGAKFGNPVAKAVAVQENPISKLCNAMVIEMLAKEREGRT